MAPIIETAIGLVLVFFVFSLITSTLAEWVGARLQWRGRFLQKYLLRVLDDPANVNWGAVLYHHPALLALMRDMREETLPSETQERYKNRGLLNILSNVWSTISSLGGMLTKTSARRLPAYIPSERFADGMIDMVIQFRKVPMIANALSPELANLASVAITEAESDFEKNVRDLEAFRSGLGRMSEGEIKRLLTMLLREVDGKSGTFEQLRLSVANWYDDYMERMTGWYKKWVRVRLFAIGLVVAVGANVDSIQLLKAFWNNPQLRTEAVAVSKQAIAKYEDQMAALKAEQKLAPDSARLDSVGKKSVSQMQAEIDTLQGLLTPLQLPIGYVHLDKEGLSAVWHNLNPCAPGGWLHLLGMLFTAISISFGAPFWFDVLKMFVNIRGAGLVPNASVNSDEKKK